MVGGGLGWPDNGSKVGSVAVVSLDRDLPGQMSVTIALNSGKVRPKYGEQGLGSMLESWTGHGW